jgi:Domain of unknown function (DUF5658)
MTRLLTTALLLLCVYTPAFAQATDRPANLMTIGYGALVGADISVTMECIGRGVCKEANPLLAWAQDKPGAFGALKVGVNTAIAVAVYKWTKPRTKNRYVALAALIGTQGIVVARNAHNLSGKRR